VLDRQSTRRGEAACGVLGLPSPDPEFAKYTASPSNSGSRPKRHRVQSRAQIRRRNGWCTALLVISSCSLTVALSGCGGSIAMNGTGTGAIIASPSTLTFGALSIGQTTGSNVSLVNRGTAAVQVTQMSVTGQSFSLSGVSDLPITVAAGGAYNLNVNFSPVAPGAATGQLMIASNASSDETTVISLSGMGAAASTTLSSLSCTSSALLGSTADACTVTLNGAAGSGGLTVSLASSNSVITVPSAVTVPAGATSAGFTATASAVSIAQTVTLTAAASGVSETFNLELGAAVPTLSVNSTSVAFGSVVVNTAAAPQPVTLTSTGTVPVTISAAALNGTGFTVSGITFPLTLNPGQAATLTVEFEPTAPGAATGQLTITSNSSTGSSAVITLSGTGTAVPAALSALSCSSGAMTGSGTDACTVTLTASAPSGGLSVNLSSSNSAVTVPSTVTVPAGATSAGFTATVSSVATDQVVTMAAGASGIFTSFTLQLNAAILALSINATSVAFGSVVVNTAATQSVTLTSTGTAPVTIDGATLTGAGFTLSGAAFPVTLNSGQTATLEVQFHPAATGVATGQLTITSNSSTGGMAVISLSGTGTASGSFAYGGSPLVNTLTPDNPSAPIPSRFFGMTIHNLASNNPGVSSGLTPFPPFQVSIFRFWDVAYWAMLEPSNGQFNWTKMDGVITVARQNGVSDFIFTFGHLPQWASTNPSDPCTGGEGVGSCAPPNMSAFDDFATQVVQRYCGTVNYYETWNEPNGVEFWDGTKAQLLTVAQHLYQIAKDPANCGCTNGTCSPNGGANPNQVLMPSISKLTQTNLSWLDSYLATAGTQYPYADIASFHGYGDTNPEDIVTQVQLLSQTLAKHGLSNRELWNTEASWGEETTSVDQQQASWLMRYHMAQVAAGVSRFVWYAYDNCDWGTLWGVSPCGNTQATPNQLTGPGEAYGVIEDWLIGANLTSCQEYQNGLWACELQRSGGYDAWMLWSSTGTSISVPVPEDSGLTVYRDWQNNVNTLPTQITVSQMPVLLENHDL
jgi:hypothetical protein